MGVSILKASEGTLNWNKATLRGQAPMLSLFPDAQIVFALKQVKIFFAKTHLKCSKQTFLVSGFNSESIATGKWQLKSWDENNRSIDTVRRFCVRST